MGCVWVQYATTSPSTNNIEIPLILPCLQTYLPNSSSKKHEWKSKEKPCHFIKNTWAIISLKQLLMYQTLVCSQAHKYQIWLRVFTQDVYISICLCNTVIGVNFTQHWFQVHLHALTICEGEPNLPGDLLAASLLHPFWGLYLKCSFHRWTLNHHTPGRAAPVP